MRKFVSEIKNDIITKHKQFTIMKIAGIVLIIFAVCNFIIVFIAAANSAGSDVIARCLSSVFMLGGVGAYLVHKANKRKKDEDNKKKWNNEN